MPPDDLLHGDPETTQEAIMQATFRALCEHGYPDLTIQRIGDEFGKSKSLLYHHYDGKDDLLLDFLALMLDRFEAEVPAPPIEDPADHLDAILDYGLAATLDEDRERFTRAMAELRAQAAHDEAYRDHFARSDAFFRNHIAEVVRAGVEDGAFADVDPERVADFVLVVLNGARTQRVTGGTGEGVAAAREEMAAYVRCRLTGAADE
ncbi:MAG: TetR family transcriptional regulator C-terminal domain-containing protein [Halobacteriaceae archaeon]